MPKFKAHAKGIACLESLWYPDDVESRLNVKPILELTSAINDTRYTHLTCNTKTEFKFNLEKLPRTESYSILYLSFHGDVGKLNLADGSTISLDELAHEMGDGFENWIIHFGSCGTLAAPEKELTDFIQKTGVSLLVGYKSYVDWTESASLDMLIFAWLQEYKNVKAFTKKVEESYPDLVKITGLRFFPE